MADLVLTTSEVALLRVVGLHSAFTPAQLAMWAHMTPTEVHGVVAGLIQKQLMAPAPGETLKLTDGGMSAVRKIMRQNNKEFWVIGERESAADPGVDEALDNWIDSQE